LFLTAGNGFSDGLQRLGAIGQCDPKEWPAWADLNNRFLVLSEVLLKHLNLWVKLSSEDHYEN